MTGVCHRLISLVYLCNCKPRTIPAYFSGIITLFYWLLQKQNVTTRKTSFNNQKHSNYTHSLQIHQQNASSKFGANGRILI